MLNTILKKSRGPFLFIRIADQKPASNAVVTHVARKYDRVYRLASGSGHSRPRSLPKLRAIYRYRSVMRTDCQAVSFLERILDMRRRIGKPWQSPLQVSSAYGVFGRACGRLYLYR